MKIPSFFRIPILPWIGNAFVAVICGNLASEVLCGTTAWSLPLVIPFALLGGWATFNWWTKGTPR